MRANALVIAVLLLAGAPALAQGEGLSDGTKRALAALRAGDPGAWQTLACAPEGQAISKILADGIDTLPHDRHPDVIRVLGGISTLHSEVKVERDAVLACAGHASPGCQSGSVTCLRAQLERDPEWLATCEAQAVEALVPLLANQRASISGSAAALLEIVTHETHGRDPDAWSTSRRVPKVVLTEVLAGVERLADGWSVNGEKKGDGDALVKALVELEKKAEAISLDLTVLVLVRCEDPARRGELERQALDAVAPSLAAAGVTGIATPWTRIDPPLPELLARVASGSTGVVRTKKLDLVVTVILVDPDRGNRVVVLYDDPDHRGRVYAEGDGVRDRWDKVVAGLKVEKIVEGAVTFVFEGRQVVKGLKEP